MWAKIGKIYQPRLIKYINIALVHSADFGLFCIVLFQKNICGLWEIYKIIYARVARMFIFAQCEYLHCVVSYLVFHMCVQMCSGV